MPPVRSGDAAAAGPFGERPAVRAYRQSGSFDDLVLALESLTEVRQGELRLEEIGRSRSGRPIVVAALGTQGEEARPPAALVIAAFERAEAAPDGARAAFELIAGRLAAPGAESAGLYVIAAPDPDALAGVVSPEPAGKSPVHPNRNFPADWDPALSAAENPGPYPLSETTTRALAQFVMQRSELSALVLLGGRGLSADRMLPEDIATIATFGAGPTEANPSGARPGSFSAFAYSTAGLIVIGADVPGVSMSGSSEFERRVDAVLQRLPRHTLSTPRVEHLGGDLWRIRVEAANAGLLATATAQAKASRRIGRVRARVEAPDVVTVLALAQGGAGSQAELVRRGPGGYDLGHWPAGERRSLDVFVRAPGDTSLTISIASDRGGRAARIVTLR